MYVNHTMNVFKIPPPPQKRTRVVIEGSDRKDQDWCQPDSKRLTNETLNGRSHKK